jgi:hypothetical protein
VTTVHFTSFKELEKEAVGPAFSIAVFQPKGFDLPKAYWADIRDPRTRTWIRPREFERYWDPLAAYRDALWGHYLARKDAIRDFFSIAEEHPFLTLVCWCPYERAAQRQLREFGTFVCHSEVVRGFLAFELGLETTVDDDRLAEMKELFDGSMRFSR